MTLRRDCPDCRTLHPVNKSGSIRRHQCVPVQCDTFALPWVTPPLTQNQLRRLHPMREAALKKAAKAEACWAIRAARLTPRLSADIVLHWRMPDHRHRDGDGAAPTLKVILDALVAEGVLPNDSWAYVPFSGVRCHPPLRGMPGCLWVEIADPITESEAS